MNEEQTPRRTCAICDKVLPVGCGRSVYTCPCGWGCAEKGYRGSDGVAQKGDWKLEDGFDERVEEYIQRQKNKNALEKAIEKLRQDSFEQEDLKESFFTRPLESIVDADN